MKIVVTGGAGFIGSNIVQSFVNEGHDVTVFDNFFLGKKENLSAASGISVLKGDVRDEQALKEAAAGADVIIHQAAASSSPMFKSNLRGAVATNIDGFINVLNAARANDAKLLYASSSTVYGNVDAVLHEDMPCKPENFYAATKHAGETLASVYAKEYGLSCIGFRYMSVYGPNEEGKGIYANLVSQFIWAMQKGEQPVIYGDGTQTRDFVYVKDVCAAHLQALDKKLGCEVINIGTGMSATLNDLVALLNRLMRTDITPHYIAMPVKGYMHHQRADISKARQLLGFEARYSLEDGVKELLGKG